MKIYKNNKKIFFFLIFFFIYLKFIYKITFKFYILNIKNVDHLLYNLNKNIKNFRIKNFLFIINLIIYNNKDTFN